MKVWNFGEREKESQPAVLALGNFDGVHRGHQHLLRRGKEIAVRRGLPFGALLFDPHPLKVLSPEKELNLLSDQETKIRWLGECGVDSVCLIPFDRELADTPPPDFARRLLLPLGTAHAVVGFNYSFGRGGKGKPEDLRRLGREYGFGVSVARAQRLGQRVISSSAIRASLAEGDLTLAAAMMGRSPCIKGRVEAGDGRGRRLGFPTANLRLADDLLTPANGVYAARGLIGGLWYDGMLNVGVRPTFGEGLPRAIEAHFFDLSQDLYGQEIFLTLELRLRGERRFASAAAISAQLREDETAARRYLRAPRFSGRIK
ncbi:MAG: riboflavin biosynthesis protein RibF [Gracilibacteraceae bacterium]|nr:riboflavin biosynthesis protein RibF [Gracilibacteraceae bacterium]